MSKRTNTFLIAATFTLSIPTLMAATSPAFNQFKQNRTLGAEVPMLAGLLRDTDAMFFAPPATNPRNLHTRLQGISDARNRLQTATIPDEFRSDLDAALRGSKPIIDTAEASLSKLDYLALSSAKWEQVMNKALPPFHESITGLQGLVSEVVDIEVVAGQRSPQVDELLGTIPENPSASEQCILSRIEELSSALTPPMIELKTALTKLRADIAVDWRVRQWLGELKANYAELGRLDQSAESVANAVSGVDSLLQENVDLSFRYWGKTAEGRFGEVIVPLKLDSDLLLQGSSGVTAHLQGTLSPQVWKLANAYGLDEAVGLIDRDLGSAKAKLRTNLGTLANPQLDGIEHLPEVLSQMTDISVVNMMPTIPTVDPNAPNYGVLAVSSGFDYRVIKRNLNDLAVDNLRSSCK